MTSKKTHASHVSLAKEGRTVGGKCYGYRDGAICGAEAEIIRWMFGRFIDGASYRSIAAELNARHVPSPGSDWKRTRRRCRGWMGSAVRAILRNEP